MNWRDCITVVSEVCHGRISTAGTCVLVTVALDNPAAGGESDEIVTSYPLIGRSPIRAA